MQAHFAILSHCVFDELVIHHWMHAIPEKMPDMLFIMVATIMDNTGGQRIARGCMILKTDMPAEHELIQELLRKAIDHVKLLQEMLDRSQHSLILVTFRLHDPTTTLGEDDCKLMFATQYTQHTVLGRS